MFDLNGYRRDSAENGVSSGAQADPCRHDGSVNPRLQRYARLREQA